MADRNVTSPLAMRPFRVADAVLAGLMVGVVALMVVPLPTWLLDILLATNLAVSVSILLVTLYVSDALKVAAFPTLLLVTTLVRLALNVSSTRLILLQADAGEVIRAFGQFVVQGNYIVGAVVFLILSVIQYVVIAKGSERVAEVGARFVLDAMPGKQMAIDAEVRAGVLDSAAAARRRRELERESQFYGAMDGAMKFVKGDVIASFIITFINLFAGLGIGVWQRDMAVVEALKRYGLLTIGDGLVTQIPALLLATAAGILVTRVAGEEPDTALGEDLGRQLFGAPRALFASGAFVGIMALVPGLPTWPFLVIATVLLLASRARVRAMRLEEERALTDPAAREAQGTRFMPVVVRWSLEVSPDFAAQVRDEVRGSRVAIMGFRSTTESVRETLFRELGVPLPACRVTVEPALPPRTVVLAIREVPALRIEVPAEDAPVSPPAGRRPQTRPAPAERVAADVLEVLRRRAAEFLGISETQGLLDRLEQVAPATVRQAVPKPVDVPLLTQVLRRLLEEQVSVRDLGAILEALCTAPPNERDPLTLAEHVRSELRHALAHRLTNGKSELQVILLDSAIEETIRAAVSKTQAGSFLTLAPAACRDIVTAVARACSELPHDAPPAILTQPDIRRFVRKLVETDLPELKVISFAELLPEVSVKPLTRVRV